MAKGSKKAEGCPCGRPLAYADCCGRWHAGAPAPDAESLMRSRYSAFVLGLDDYLIATWHPTTRPASVADPDRAITRWLGLEVRRAGPETVDADGVGHARVEFVARCRIGGRGHRLHEDSRFVREDGRWYYVDGEPR
ncbi:MAG: hypothetical protein RIS35_1281 [Pseudomonadota bacterium]